MSEQHISTWKSKINALGPGIMMASAAVGGSHLIASTQAGALYGWQLALIIVLTNLFKYPFFRFSAHYTLDTGKSLIEGYAEKSRIYLWVFLILCIAAATINAGAVAIVTAAIVKMAIPSPTPWTLAGLGFLIALMGWMPAPIEISAINSLWVTEKQRLQPSSYHDGIFDFNVGYITSAVLAVVFLALGAYVQYGNGEEVQMAGGKYVGQLINMYAVTIGDWSRPLVAFIAFACMYGTTITVVDGYARAIAEPVRLLRGSEKTGNAELFAWNIWVAGSGLAVIFWFNSAMAELLKFAMITAFVSAPVFAWLNYRLVKGDKRHRLTAGMNFLAIVGLLYLTGFAVLFLLNLSGLLA